MSPLLAHYINGAHGDNARGEFASARKLAQLALALAPDSPEGWYNLGLAEAGLGRRKDAIHALLQVRRCASRSPEALNSVGLQLVELDAQAEAEACLKQALALAPRYAYALSNLGKLRHQQRRFDEAEHLFRQALEQPEQLPAFYVNLGSTLHEKRAYDAAEVAFRQALEMDPAQALAWSNLGTTLAMKKDYAGAVEALQKALALDPQLKIAQGLLLRTKMRVCDWHDLDSLSSLLVTRINRGETASAPHEALSVTDDPLVQHTLAVRFSASEFGATGPYAPSGKKPDPASGAKIRLGYYSADFRTHPVGLLIAELLELHDKSRFEVTGFSFIKAPADPMQARLSQSFDHFVDVSGYSDEQVVKLSRDMGIDIAIDLTGYTEGCRPAIFSARAAPVQASYLGYAGTLGAEWMDYLIADRVVCPEEHQRFYSEKIAYLPHCFLPHDGTQVVADPPASRQDHGLPESGFVFCCFNNHYKLHPEVFDIWMRLLSKVAGSVLWLSDGDAVTRENLLKEVAARGVDTSRIIFARRVDDMADHLARYRLADLFLDTLPYNAHTTACDALWAGVPVLTRIGNAFAGRVAASMLHAIGAPEMVTRTSQEYEDLAVQLATQPARLQAIRQKVADQRLASPLFDSTRLARDIEALYAAMQERRLRRAPPAVLMA